MQLYLYIPVQAAFHQVSGLFEKALGVEPNSVDALVQLAHIRTMLSLPGCREILERAQGLCRNNEEAIQICQTYGLDNAKSYGEEQLSIT